MRWNLSTLNTVARIFLLLAGIHEKFSISFILPVNPHLPQRVLILYGTQTGTAEDFAFDVAGSAFARGFTPVCQTMDSYDLSLLTEEHILVCVVSTTGDGDPPATMSRSWASLRRRSLPAGALSRMQYAVFGCGDSGYPKFNYVARRLDLRQANKCVDIEIIDCKDFFLRMLLYATRGVFFAATMMRAEVCKGIFEYEREQSPPRHSQYWQLRCPLMT